MSIFIHETAIIDGGAQIGLGTKIWHFSHVCSGASIGKNVTIGQNVFVGNNVKIGDGCKIQNNVSIYDNVYLQNDVFCGPSVVFTNVHNPRAHVSRKNEYLSTHVFQGATLGANATIVCGVSIQEFAFVGAGACVTKDVKKFELVTGVPAKHRGWIDKYGEKLPFFGAKKSETFCDKTGGKYVFDGTDVIFFNRPE